MKIKLKNFVQTNQVQFKLTGSNEGEVLDQLIKPLLKNKVVNNAEKFKQDVLRREKQLTTVLANGIAFPHARSMAVSKLSISVGIAEGDGLLFGKDFVTDGIIYQNQPVKVFFLIAVPAFAPTAHMSILQTLSTFIKDEEKFNLFLKQRTPGLAARMLGAYNPNK